MIPTVAPPPLCTDDRRRRRRELGNLVASRELSNREDGMGSEKVRISLVSKSESKSRSGSKTSASKLHQVVFHPVNPSDCLQLRLPVIAHETAILPAMSKASPDPSLESGHSIHVVHVDHAVRATLWRLRFAAKQHAAAACSLELALLSFISAFNFGLPHHLTSFKFVCLQHSKVPQGN
ncbi:hypothetical protein CMUS01_06965 [Colletotrichum musicola]|uniref:Uncharacterized protein n=1 Tax=Colletotrichum musicola TaxID=2175873 RepID=A0A8H6NH78_9PEZI|nr:hypothetical protein CMUS01_06965 [Colletotrichum musicola]